SRLINLEATAKETFRYNASLYNGRNHAAVFEFNAGVPAGWMAAIRIDGVQVRAFRLDSNKTQDISIEINPSPIVTPGKYSIPVTATVEGETLQLDLEAVVKGNYAVVLTTPEGRLSDEITEGSRKPIHLTIKNTGSLPLDGLELSAQAPSKWEASFEPAKIERLEAGKDMDVIANVHVPDKTIAGDYVTDFTVKNSNATANATFRLTVTTSWLAGWLGVVIILLAIALIYYLIRKYGRR
ncbi:MAG TPA: NEW3 domain-containing protein, partial [Chitinophagaceae bacterium]|nr:NEW3 domain-containing protein [Chitinophagaceae bacterium]